MLFTIEGMKDSICVIACFCPQRRITTFFLLNLSLEVLSNFRFSIAITLLKDVTFTFGIAQT